MFINHQILWKHSGISPLNLIILCFIFSCGPVSVSAGGLPCGLRDTFPGSVPGHTYTYRLSLISTSRPTKINSTKSHIINPFNSRDFFFFLEILLFYMTLCSLSQCFLNYTKTKKFLIKVWPWPIRRTVVNSEQSCKAFWERKKVQNSALSL